MKYNAKNKPLQCFMTQSSCYKNTTKMPVKGILWHSTGCNNPTLKRYVQPDDDSVNKNYFLKLIGTNTNKNDYNHKAYSVGMNAFIGKLADGTVTTIQTMPWNYRPWGCGNAYKGGPSCNDGWIQFEICEDSLRDKDYFNKVYKEACELTAYLCREYGIDPYGTQSLNGIKVPTILCHADSYKLKVGSNHGDVYHWFNLYGKNMDNVRKDVKALIDEASKPTTKPTNESTKPTTSKVTFKNGETVTLKNTKIYSSSTTKNASFTKSGVYYIWNNLIVNNRVRITNKASNVGKTGQVTGFVNINEITKGGTPTTNTSVTLKVGDKIKIISGAKYTSGTKVPAWVISSTCYIRKISGNNITFSIKKTGDITGIVDKKYVKKI